MKRAPCWNPEQLKELGALAGKKSCKDIGILLGRSKDAVKHKINELGLPKFAITFEQKHEAATKPKAPRGPMIARFKNHAAAAEREIKAQTRSLTVIEWCPQCFSPVSNWQEHFERQGHKR